MLNINADRLLSDLYELRQIGAYKTGVHRPTLSEDDMRARRWLVDKLEAVGHAAHIDGIATVISRAPGDGPKLLAGSHIESQNHAGWLDGALGIVYALEAARAVAEDSDLKARGGGVDVIAFSDEEGHFGGFFGSKSFIGDLSEDTIDAARDRTHGTPLREMLATAGLAGVPRTTLERDRYRGFLEAHIEQGDSLESDDLSIGVVTSIVAIWQYRVVCEGAQNHAGTTRMATRKDAGAALRRICRRIEETFPDIAAKRSVWTVGRMTLEPGGPSIIPGRAEMLFQFRDADPDVLARLHAALATIVTEEDSAGPCSAQLEVISQTTPAVMAREVQSAFVAAADAFAPTKHIMMPSGAGHDAQVIAPHLPTGMLFVPSIGGISHHWSENTSDDDIVVGGRVFAGAAGALLSQP
ncbi:MAG: Zn-dependent hydrolase [Pseudomonadota bacterium]